LEEELFAMHSLPEADKATHQSKDLARFMNLVQLFDFSPFLTLLKKSAAR
jgi:hypothetical protein